MCRRRRDRKSFNPKTQFDPGNCAGDVARAPGYVRTYVTPRSAHVCGPGPAETAARTIPFRRASPGRRAENIYGAESPNRVAERMGFGRSEQKKGRKKCRKPLLRLVFIERRTLLRIGSGHALFVGCYLPGPDSRMRRHCGLILISDYFQLQKIYVRSVS